MAYRVITPSATEPVTLEEAKLHLRVDIDDDDALIAGLITAARELAEHYTGRAFGTQTLEMALRCFPYCCRRNDHDRGIDLDMPPVASVTSIKYTDGAGAEQTVAPAAYSLSLYGLAQRITPAYATYWPISQDIADAVRIRYVTGYTNLPKAAKQALLLMIGHLYANREAVGPTTMAEMPMGACALLDTIKIWSK